MPVSEWRRYRLSWRLASPLHIGYRTIGTIARTRLWVPGRNVWGAMIDALARAQGATSQTPVKFGEVQTAINAAMRFEAWFIGPTSDQTWDPEWKLRKEDETGENGLHYGDLPEREMQRMVLGANVGTAIDHGPNIADEGMLFETEYIAPRILFGPLKGNPLWLVGHMWVKDGASFSINGGLLGINDLVARYLTEVSMGGEQKSGYGRLRDGQITPVGTPQHGDNPLIAFSQEMAIPFMVTYVQGQQMRGQIEPIVGRTTSDDEKKKKGHGANLEDARFCWLTGSVCTPKDSNLVLDLTYPGIARMAESA